MVLNGNAPNCIRITCQVYTELGGDAFWFGWVIMLNKCIPVKTEGWAVDLSSIIKHETGVVLSG